jgi:hypothetical protein
LFELWGIFALAEILNICRFLHTKIFFEKRSTMWSICPFATVLATKEFGYDTHDTLSCRSLITTPREQPVLSQNTAVCEMV